MLISLAIVVVMLLNGQADFKRPGQGKFTFFAWSRSGISWVAASWHHECQKCGREGGLWLQRTPA